ncbi:hypothetical protein NDL58_002507 [Staphylococcus pseudintermedius]|uniref:hypothetical protein n=1 Tax=Staphylococcus pseudintermedius TaxID=283734 RepID=UPI001A0C24F4|nr:hypothetical protein [Staphylococcus pseudintermedius]EJH4557002.1 hypothetical protein [Staphylococcus pseudintermedius]HCT0479459.1 hypothetical protein [Staphylococcus pseudintermedius]
MAPIHAISVTDIDIDFVVLAIHPICFLNQLIKINSVAGVYDSPHYASPFHNSQNYLVKQIKKRNKEKRT